VDEGHYTDDDAKEAGQQRQDHESPCSIPVCCEVRRSKAM